MKQEPKEIPNPDMPDDDSKDAGDVNQWLNNFEDDAASTVASSSAPKRRKASKVLVCVICKRSSEDGLMARLQMHSLGHGIYLGSGMAA